MTHPANTGARDEAIRNLASKFSEVAGGQPLDISVAAATVFIVAQADHVNSTAYNDYIVKKLKQVVALYEPQAVTVHLTPDQEQELLAALKNSKPQPIVADILGAQKCFSCGTRKGIGYLSRYGIWACKNSACRPL